MTRAAAQPSGPRPAPRPPVPKADQRPLFAGLLRRIFSPVRFPEEAADTLRDLHARGTPIYVMRSAGILNYLYLQWVLGALGLPVAKAVSGLRPWLLRPLAWLFRQRARCGAEEVVRASEAGEPSIVFLRRPKILRAKGAPTDDAFTALVAHQRDAERAIFLVPQILIFKRAPVRLRPGIKEAVLGSAEVPGRIHAFVSFFANRKRAFVQQSQPIDLSQVVGAEPELEDAILARKVRGSLGVGLARELMAVVGPPLKPRERMIEEAMRDRTLREELEREAERSGRSLQQVEKEARGALWEIAAAYSPAVLDAAHTLARWIFARLYDRIEVDEEGLRQAADASKRAPLVICPTHRSHMDYLLMSHILMDRGMTPPLVAAGANLSFWPLGPLFRRTGAYFIRRSFRGDAVYGSALAAYVRKLVRDGNTQEFFLEGGRTRTGRILPPRLGLLSMQVDAWLAGARDDIHFVPVAIDYTRLMEVGAYARELTGGEKVRESLRALVKTPFVLRERWGQATVQVGQPVSLARFAESIGLEVGAIGPEEQRRLVQALARHLSWQKARLQTVTPTALLAAGLLASPGKAVGETELSRRIELLYTLAVAVGARFSDGLEPEELHPRAGPLAEALENFRRDGLVTSQSVGGEILHRIPDGARGSVAFYKNNVAHHFRDEALLAAALLSFPPLSASREAVRERLSWLSELLEQELPPRNGESDAAFDGAIRRLSRLDLVEEVEGSLRVLPAGMPSLAFLRTLLWDLIEAYLVVAAESERLEAGPMDQRAFVRACFERGRKLQRTGWVLFPESLNEPTFRQVVGSLNEQGYLVLEQGKLKLGTSFADAAARDRFSKQLLRMTR